MLAPAHLEGSRTTQRILSKQLSEGSRRAYESYLAVFRRWLSSNAATADLVTTETIDASRLNESIVMDFLSEVYDIDRHSFSSYGSAVSAIKYLMISQNVVITQKFTQDLKRYLNGVKKDMAQQRRDGTRSCQVGKKPLTFNAYQAICEKFLEGATGRYAKNNIFAHAFLVLSWNLMCRSESTQSINIRHMSWVGDCLVITIAKSKTDQAGAKSTQDKHVFPNPLNPAICPILALALHFATTPPDFSNDNGSAPRVFNGPKQAKRFADHLLRIISSAPPDSVIRVEISEAKDTGTHGVRKGSFTFLVNATTAGPSHGTAMNRAQFSLGVLNRYLFSERAGDCYAGRILCGLPVKTAKFATVGPELDPNFPDADGVINTIFPVFSDIAECRQMLRMFLANLIYHSDFLKRTLPSDHLLFKNPIFMDEARLARLREKIIAPRSDAPSATGIPPHTLIIKGIDDIKEWMSGSPSGQSGGGTTQRMYDKMQDMLDSMHETIKALHPADGASSVETANSPVETTPIGPLFPLFEWSDGLGLRCLPQDYQLQGAITMRDALRLWYLSAGIAKGAALPPLCKMRSIDLHSRHYRKNYCLLKANINTFVAGSESFVEPTDAQSVMNCSRAMTIWMKGLLVEAREWDLEHCNDGGDLKRFRSECRVSELGIAAFHRKLKLLMDRGLVSIRWKSPTNGAE